MTRASFVGGRVRRQSMAINYQDNKSGYDSDDRLKVFKHDLKF